MANLQAVPDLVEPSPETDHEAVQAWVDSVNQRHAAELRVLQNRINNLVQQNADLQRQLATRDQEIALLSNNY